MDEKGFQETTPADIRAMIEWLRDRGGAGEGFDVVIEGETPSGDAARASEIVTPWADAGCTWWLDARWHHESQDRMREVRERLEAGPPKL
jgi:hypothetical protein